MILMTIYVGNDTQSILVASLAVVGIIYGLKIAEMGIIMHRYTAKFYRFISILFFLVGLSNMLMGIGILIR